MLTDNKIVKCCKKHGMLTADACLMGRKKGPVCKECSDANNAKLLLRRGGLQNLPESLIALKRASLMLRRAKYAAKEERMINNFLQARLDKLSTLTEC